MQMGRARNSVLGAYSPPTDVTIPIGSEVVTVLKHQIKKRCVRVKHAISTSTTNGGERLLSLFFRFILGDRTP
jgi:hypothetical protein